MQNQGRDFSELETCPTGRLDGRIGIFGGKRAIPQLACPISSRKDAANA